ncbi:MAG: FtsL-like putative cell division protein [Salinivirgaceae bacterium]|jgi:hypothetical protein
MAEEKKGWKLFGKNSDGKPSLKSLLDGSILTKDAVLDQMPYVLFITFIAVIYIGNRYHAEKTLRQTKESYTELKEMRAESITAASKLMNMSKQSVVARMVKEKGLELKESVKPPKKLLVDSDE